MPGTYPTDPLVAHMNPSGGVPVRTVPFWRPFWSTVIALGMRFGQLWPR